jgi:hypothetical protein
MNRFVTHLKYWAWQYVVKGVLGIIYISVISDGARILLPDLGKKLSKIPFLGVLADYEGWHRLDCAHVFAFFMLVAVFFLWSWLIRLWLRPHDGAGEGWDAQNYQRLVTVLAAVMLCADAFLFYRAVVEMDWAGGALSLTGIIATAAYVAVQVFVSFVSVVLKHEVAISHKG